MNLSKFKRKIKEMVDAGNPIQVELISYFGIEKGTREWDEKVPPRLKGIRSIVSSNSVGFSMTICNSDQLSECRIPRASLVDIGDSLISVFSPCVRELNDQEKAFDAAWQKIADTKEYRDQAYVDAISDGSSSYYQKKRFYRNNNNPDMSYLFCGNEKQHGCRSFYDADKQKRISDDNIAGKKILCYRVNWKGMEG